LGDPHDRPGVAGTTLGQPLADLIEISTDLRGDASRSAEPDIAGQVRYPITLSPEIAALAMSGSSALVAVNALLLRRTRLGAHKPRRPGTGNRSQTLHETAAI
jgi:hypothetical protein